MKKKFSADEVKTLLYHLNKSNDYGFLCHVPRDLRIRYVPEKIIALSEWASSLGYLRHPWSGGVLSFTGKFRKSLWRNDHIDQTRKVRIKLLKRYLESGEIQ